MDDYLNQIKTISGEIWVIFKAAVSTWNPESDNWWEELISVEDKCIMKYKDTPYYDYALKYAYLVICEIERKHKEETDARQRISENGNENE